MDDKKQKKKKFVEPEAEIVSFDNDDIITLSAHGAGGWDAGHMEGWW